MQDWISVILHFDIKQSGTTIVFFGNKTWVLLYNSSRIANINLNIFVRQDISFVRTSNFYHWKSSSYIYETMSLNFFILLLFLLLRIFYFYDTV